MRKHSRFTQFASMVASAGLLAVGGSALESLRPSPAHGAEEIRILVGGPLVFSLSVESLETFAETGEVTGGFENYARFLDKPTQIMLRQLLGTPLPLDVNTVANMTYSPLGRDALENVGKVVQIAPGINGFKGLRAAVINAAANAGPDGWTLIDALKAFPTDSIDISAGQLLKLQKELSIYFDYNQAVVQAIQAAAQAEAAGQPAVSLAALTDLTRPGPYRFSRGSIIVTNPAARQTQEGFSVNYDFPVDTYLPQGLSQPSPVVIISHGFGAVKEDFVFLAEHLASYGYTVLVPEHVGSDLSYRRGFLEGRLHTLLSPAEFINRPQEISFLIDELERLVATNPYWADQLNLDQIGLIGDSLGSTTVLALAGAEINYARLADACAVENIIFNFAQYLECQARFLPPQNYSLKDPRIKAVIAAHPLGGFLYGPEGFSQIDIPLLMLSGSNDVVSPVVVEQVHPFIWTQTAPKYLALLITGTHFSSKPPGEGVDAIPNLLTGAHRDVGAAYYKMLNVAFLEAYLRGRSEFSSFLTARSAQVMSAGQPMTLDIVQSLTPEQLVAAYGGQPPVPIIPAPVESAPAPRQEPVLQEIARTGVLKVAFRKDAAPFGYVDTSGQWTGYCHDFVRGLKAHLDEKLGRPVEIRLVELPSGLSDRFSLVRSGTVDLECGPNTIQQGVEGIAFSQPIFTTGTRLIVPAANGANVNPALPLKGIRIGVLKDSTTETFVRDRYPEAEIVLFEGITGRGDAIQSVTDGRIDTFAGDGILTYAELLRQGLSPENYTLLPELPLTCDFYGLILPNNDPEWIKTVNAFLNSEAEQPIWDAWLGETRPYVFDETAYCLNR